MTRWLSVCSWSVVSLFVAGAAHAQNGSNYHVLTHGGDTAFFGLGAGGAQTASDGLCTFVAGEDLRGSRLTQLGDFGYRQVKFLEGACVLHAGPTSTRIRFPQIVFMELDGLNGNLPPVFTNPTCSVPSFPLGASGFVPYGTGPGSTASFVLVAGGGTAPILLPNNGLAPAGAGGTMTPLAAASAALGIASTGFCWQVQFSWAASALVTADDIDGLAHFLANSPDDNQYWLMSGDEQGLWQSQSVATDAGATAVLALTANVDYDLMFVDADPVTVATLAPRSGVTPYSAWTANVSNEFGVVVNPNGGFDIGRGSSAVSFSGTAGVPNPATGKGNQDPSLGPGVVPTLGFATFDNGGDHDGSVRLTWISLDLLGALGGNPDTDPGVLKAGGTVRLPVHLFGFLQQLTHTGFQFLGHVTRPGFVSPLPSFFAPFTIGGASWQMPLTGVAAPCLGVALNITYGTSGRLGTLGAPGKLTFDQTIAATSGSRQLFLFD